MNLSIRKITAIAAISVLVLTGCGAKSVTNPTVSGGAGSKPVIGAPQGTAPATLVTNDIIVGSGKEAVATSTLTVHYTLMAWSTGQVVESSWDGGSPATFPLSGVIVGWQQGIPGMKEGGRRLLVIPAELGYGAAGGGPIGPNETCLLYTSPSPRDRTRSRMPSSA